MTGENYNAPLTIHKVLLEQSHIHLFPHYLWLLLRYNSKGEAIIDTGPAHLEYSISGSFKEK